MSVILPFGISRVDERPQQQALRAKIRRVKSGLPETERPRLLTEDGLIDLTAPDRR